MTEKVDFVGTSVPEPPGEPTVVLSGVCMNYNSSVAKAPRGTPIWKAVLHKVSFMPYKQKVHALSDINLVARAGDSIGLVGSNGAGKSTLLRVIAGVEQPSEGIVLARSKPRLQAVGAALVPQLSGWQNIRLGLAALGFTGPEVADRGRQIAELAGLGDALERPMRTYSSGMRARLIFSINAHSKAEILLIDEALATGDATFASRAKDAMADLREGAGTIFLVSHTLRSIESMCSRAVWMHLGSQVADGPTKKITSLYRQWVKAVTAGEDDKAAAILAEASAEYPTLQKVVYTTSTSAHR